MAEWTRTTPWRQGHLLTKEAIKAIGLTHPQFPDETMVIVASHDCDITYSPDREPQVEVVVGHRISTVDGNNTNAKSPRTLHIEFEGAESILGEFVITEKKSISKDVLAAFEPAADARLSPSGLRILQRWLASRYRRSAFPDEFERRLKESGLAEKIARAVKPSSMMIHAVYFEVDEGREIAHSGPDDVYALDIILLYASEPDPQAAEAVANEVKGKIEQAFKAKLFHTESGKWQSIELKYIDAISDEAMSVRLSQRFKMWRLDHISMGADPQHPVLSE